jgi:hypothetical protein
MFVLLFPNIFAEVVRVVIKCLIRILLQRVDADESLIIETGGVSTADCKRREFSILLAMAGFVILEYPCNSFPTLDYSILGRRWC